MSVRTSMADLISQVRTLIGDFAGTDQVLSDQEIQDAMDVHRCEARYMPLKPLVSYVNGVTQYLIWVSHLTHWESNAVLVDDRYRSLIPGEADCINGRWAFSSSQTAVLITGFSYDLYGAAADLLETWAAKSATEFDFSADGATFHRSQKGEALRKLATEYRKKQQVMVIDQTRSDMEYGY